ncbi:MAG: hypothetical protein QM775_16695 [Pirellulales bacterium]
MTTSAILDRDAAAKRLGKDADGAFRFEAAAPEITPAEGGDAERPRGKIKMFSRSAKPVEHPWWWAPVVHDFAGMKHKPSIPIDYRHDDRQDMGYLNVFNVTPEGLTCEGELIAFKPDDRAAECLYKGPKGVPYSASIDFDGPMRLEDVPNGMSAVVNGQTFQGPLIVVREWTLFGVALCLYGADTDAASQFNKRGLGSAQLQKEGTAVDGNDKGAPASAAEAAEWHKKSRDELQKFVGKFGAENGAKWFGEGKTYAEALELHTEALGTQLTAANKATEDANAKLAAVKLGEEGGGQFNEGEQGGKGGKKSDSGLSKFGACFSLPKKTPAAATKG